MRSNKIFGASIIGQGKLSGMSQEAWFLCLVLIVGVVFV